MASTPATRLTLKHLREVEVWPLVETVEHWHAHLKRRKDPFGVGDVLAVGLKGRTMLIQTTSRANVSSRLKKIHESGVLEHLAASGWEFRAHGWEKKGNRWQLLRDVDVFEWSAERTLKDS